MVYFKELSYTIIPVIVKLKVMQMYMRTARVMKCLINAVPSVHA